MKRFLILLLTLLLVLCSCKNSAESLDESEMPKIEAAANDEKLDVTEIKYSELLKKPSALTFLFEVSENPNYAFLYQFCGEDANGAALYIYTVDNDVNAFLSDKSVKVYSCVKNTVNFADMQILFARANMPEEHENTSAEKFINETNKKNDGKWCVIRYDANNTKGTYVLTEKEISKKDEQISPYLTAHQMISARGTGTQLFDKVPRD